MYILVVKHIVMNTQELTNRFNNKRLEKRGSTWRMH